MRSEERLKRDVGRRIAELRIEANGTQQWLAERMAMSVQYIRRVEGGGANLSLGSLSKFAAALRVDPAELLTRPRSRARRRPGRPTKA